MKTFLKGTAVVAAIYGISGVLMANFLLTTYGISTEASAILMTRFFGSTLIAWAVVIWLVSDSTDWVALRAALAANVVGNTVGFVVAILATVAGAMNAVGWSAVLIYAVFVLGALYYLVSGRQALPSRA
jgi:hypothetical protein